MQAPRLGSAMRTLARLSPPVLSARMYSRFFVDHRLPLEPALEAPRHEIETTDAGTISYYADTAQGGDPVLLLHGIHAAASAYDMRPLFERFRRERSVYALDLPGFGFSDRTPREYRPDVYVHAIEHMLRQLADQGRVDVVALSLTAELVARVTHETEDLVRSLVLISPTGFSSEHERSKLEREARRGRAADFESLREVVGDQPLYDLLVSKPSIRYFLRKSFRGAIDKGMADYDYMTSHQPGARFAPLAFASGRLFPEGDPLRTYERVKVPTLVLHGEGGHAGFGELTPFVGAHPNFSAERLAPTRELPHFEAREQTAQAISTFWRRAERPSHLPGKPRIVGRA